MKRLLYVWGMSLLFALLGVWAGRLADGPVGWSALLGAAIGWGLGSAFAPATKSA